MTEIVGRYFYKLNDEKDMLVHTINEYSSAAIFDVNDPLERDMIATSIAQDLHYNNPDLYWPIKLDLYDVDHKRVATFEVDMNMEPCYDAFETWSKDDE